jgi:hypothetical protein
MHSTGRGNEQNISNPETALFHLKRKVSTEQLSTIDFFQICDLHISNKATFYLFIIFVGISAKCKNF